jgi:N-acetylglutamate synthase-like GNAT family acetyltransferase
MRPTNNTTPILIEVADPDDWLVYHSIRRTVLFEERGLRGYDPDHPDEHAPANLPLLLKIDGDAVGTARLDRRDGGIGVVRMVAIRPDYRRLGVGRAMMNQLEALAQSLAITVLYVNAARDAVSFWDRIGFRPFTWDPSELEHMQPGCLQMQKALRGILTTPPALAQ